MNKRIMQKDLKPVILEVLREKGGGASRHNVIVTINNKYSMIFNEPYFQEEVGGGNVPRWKHWIDWAKRKLVEEGKIKTKEESGWGIWELK